MKSINSQNKELIDFNSNFHKTGYIIKEESVIADQYRNRSFSVITKQSKKGFFLKQLKEFTINHQEQFYRECKFFQLLDNHKITLHTIPFLIDFNEKLSISTYQYIDGYATFSAHDYSRANFILLGKIVNEIHVELAKIPNPIPLIFQNKYPSNIFLIDPSESNDYSKTYLSALGLSKAFAFFEEHGINEKYLTIVADCVKKWDCTPCKTLIHGDMKTGNFLFGKDTTDLILIDWENIIYGDPNWDLSALLFSIFVKEDFKNPLKSIENVKNLFQSVLTQISYADKDSINLYFLMQIIMYLVDNHGNQIVNITNYMEEILLLKLNNNEDIFQWA